MTKSAKIVGVAIVLFGLIAWFKLPKVQAASCSLPTATQSTISTYAHARGFNIGALIECFDRSGKVMDNACTQTVTKEYTGEINPFEVQWSVIEPTQGAFNWIRFDAIMNLVKSAGAKLHYSHLIWGTRSGNSWTIPKWVFPSATDCGNLTRDQLLAIMKNHIQTIINHGGDTVAEWNVVNEVFANSNESKGTYGLLSNNCWYKKIGPDYIDKAFQFAKAANPKGLLVLNEFGGDDQKINNIFDYIKGAKARGIPIDAIGWQTHLASKDGSQFTALVTDNLTTIFQKAQDAGVKVIISEFDVYQAGHTQEDVAKVYKNSLALCLKYGNCVSFETWGISDKYTWMRQPTPGLTDAKPLLFDENYQRKPAYYGVMQALAENATRVCNLKFGDFNHDGQVNKADYDLLISNFGNPYTIYDYNNLVANYNK